MESIIQILDTIVLNYKNILHNNLIGIYLHGSLAMNCFNPDTSDIDFLVVVKENIKLKEKRKLIDVLLQLSRQGPKKGFEMSLILEKDANFFKHPTPFILHYSKAFEERYLDEAGFICGDSVDTDLAAHITVIIHRGICLYGKPIKDVFQPVPTKYYVESIIGDIGSAKEDIIYNPIYFILNLCRVLYYLEDEVVCSKKEGGEWAIGKLPYPYREIIQLALSGYCNYDTNIEWNKGQLICFADYMLKEIKASLNIDVLI